MIDTLLAAVLLAPAEARFPCHVEVSVSAPGWEREINQALGVYSALSGTEFVAGDGGIHFTIDSDLGSEVVSKNVVNVLGEWRAMEATIALTPAGELTHKERLTVAQHELGHAYWLGHSTDPTSIMFPTVGKVHTLRASDKQTIAANGCKVY